MLQYLRNIIPRIQQFSEQLSHIEVFVDKPWVLIDEQENTHEYVFLRDKRLILSLNGKVIVGSWELLPTGKLLINRVTDNILLQQAFVDEGILLLKQSGTEDLPFILINEKVIPDKDPVKYLEQIERKKKQPEQLPNVPQKDEFNPLGVLLQFILWMIAIGFVLFCISLATKK